MAEEGKLRGNRFAVFELDSNTPCIEVLLGHEAAHFDDIGLGNRPPRVKEGFGEITVIGRKEDATRRIVEAPYRVDSTRHVFQVFAHTETPLWISHGRDNAARLVKDQVNEILGHDSLAIDFDPIAPWVRSHAELGSHLTVDPHAPGSNELFGVAA
jgi:hypothetical protein